MNSQWVPFEEGAYIIKRAFLKGRDQNAVAVEKATIEVYKTRDGMRRLKGFGMIQPFLMLEILEENDELDLFLDFGGEFKYHIEKPAIQAGKALAPNVETHVQFHPSQPWKQVPRDDFETIWGSLKFLQSPQSTV